MATELKAIETVYNGNRFRSRLEAKWAVFFTSIGVRYEYELQGYDLGKAGWYLPDFWIPKWDAWVEIKPRLKYTELNNKCNELAIQSGKHVLLIEGNPYAEDMVYDYDIYFYPIYDYANAFPWFFVESLTDAYLWIQNCVSGAYCLDTKKHEPSILWAEYENVHALESSYKKANQARFEHGERG